MSRAASRILTFVFLAIISLPLAGNLMGFDGADPTIENREMTAWPEFDATPAALRNLPSGLTAWFSDHFAFRARLIRWNAAIKVFVLNTSSSSDVILGNNGWLFYAGDGSLEDLVSATPLPEAEVANWQEAIGRAREWTRAHGMGFLFVLAPDKHAIYPEQLPDSVHRVGRVSRADQLFATFKDFPDVLDLRPTLLEARNRERVYHRTDTHWNHRGVYSAYNQIIDALRQQAPDVPPAWSRSDFEERRRVTPGGDLAGMLGLTRLLTEDRLELIPKRPRLARVVEPEGASPVDEEGFLVTEIPGSHLPRAVVFRDSFVSPLVPFLSEHFSRVVYLWQKDFVPESLRSERPDVVIHEMVGRRLHTFIPSPELIPN